MESDQQFGYNPSRHPADGASALNGSPTPASQPQSSWGQSQTDPAATAPPVAPAPVVGLASEAPAVRAEDSWGSGPSVGTLSDSGTLYDEALVETAPTPQSSEGTSSSTRPGLLADLLTQMIELKASDLHISAGNPPLYRLRGELVRTEFDVMQPRDIQEMLYAILTQKQREKYEENLELDLSYSLPGVARYRVNIYRQRDAMGAAFRLIPFEIKTLEQLGVPQQVSQFARLPRGLVLVTGPTGSGKSTTLAALIDIVNSESAKHIMSVEDPIEFLHNHKKSAVHQREVGGDTHTFAAALKHVLRQDPDVILVGEMRDLETISMALTAAETGHLVFATLHTNTAPSSVDRIIDVFPPHQQQQIRVQLAASLQGVVTQTLVPTADGKSRAVACEILVVTPAVANLIREAKTHQIFSAMQAGAALGMVTMDKTLAQLVLSGKVRKEDAEERVHDKDNFLQLLRGQS